MRKGTVINGYKILDDFTTSGGGLCKWTFAQKGGKTYFIKEFLYPKYPTSSAPGSLESKEKKKIVCQRFENHHKALMDAINSRCAQGGNLIFTKDFFRLGSTYYKITEKIDVAGLKPEAIHQLPLESKILILKTIAHSLNILHQAGIVHGDLKPENILIKQTKTTFYTSKLIDFDNSFFATHPTPLSEEMVGDLAYFSPEMARFIKGEYPHTQLIGTSSDIFALGLLFAFYLTGKQPEYPSSRYAYPCLAVNEGKKLKVTDKNIPFRLKRMIHKMLLMNPHDRPSVQEVFTLLKSIDLDGEDKVLRLPREIPEKTFWEKIGEDLGILLTGKIPEETASTPTPKTGLKGGLLKTKKKEEKKEELILISKKEVPEKVSYKNTGLKGKGLRSIKHKTE